VSETPRRRHRTPDDGGGPRPALRECAGPIDSGKTFGTRFAVRGAQTPWPGMSAVFATRLLKATLEALEALFPALLFGVRLWASVCLALCVAFWLELDNAFWAGTSAAIVCQPHLGASLRKGWFRLIGTVIGAIAIVVLTACFPQDRVPFLVGLALWGAGCA